MLAGRAVEADHRLIGLDQRVPGTAAQQVGQLAVDVGYGLEHPAAAEP
ncbi:MAG TPA: hypothetical protein VGM12_24510 [Trebonia sp.]